MRLRAASRRWPQPIRRRLQSPNRPMAPIPDPRPGLIFRYGYVWVRDFKKNPEFVGEDRPACIVMKVSEDQEDSLQAIGGSVIEPGDVIILPITTSPPRPGDTVIELSPDEKRICRVDPARRSWLVVSEFNADIWPNADMSLVQGQTVSISEWRRRDSWDASAARSPKRASSTRFSESSERN